MKILIIENSTSLNFLYTQFIQKLGFYSMSAINGKDALNKLINAKKDQSIPDAILLDMEMPVMDGFEFVKKIKKEKEYEDFKNIPIIVCTSIEDEHKIKRINDCITTCIFKTTLKEIRVKISNALSKLCK